jgi:hypothetical protein
MLSLVVQAISFTITLFFQTIELISDDFHTFGLPTSDNLIKLSSNSSLTRSNHFSLKISATHSLISANPI